MNAFVDITDKDNTITIPIIGGVSLTTGDGLETKQRYMYSYNKYPVSLTYRRRNTALTATVQLAITPMQCLEQNELFMEYIAKCEKLAGRRVTLIWNDEQISNFIVQQVQISAAVDCVDIFSQVNISFNLTEGFVKKPVRITSVMAL